jgi:hypothetical protein
VTQIVVTKGTIVESDRTVTSEPLVPSTFLPADVEPLSPQEILAAVQETLEGTPRPDLAIEIPQPPPLGRSWAYDFLHYRFRTVGGRGPLVTDGLSTLQSWVEKVLHSDRGASPIWPDGYGMVRPFDVVGEPYGHTPFDSLRARVRDAVIYHPRIVDIQDWRIITPTSFDQEYVEFSFTLVLDDDSLIPIPNMTLP